MGVYIDSLLLFFLLAVEWCSFLCNVCLLILYKKKSLQYCDLFVPKMKLQLFRLKTDTASGPHTQLARECYIYITRTSAILMIEGSEESLAPGELPIWDPHLNPSCKMKGGSIQAANVLIQEVF